MPRRLNAPRRMNARDPTMFPHTVTVYTTTVEYDPQLTENITTHITVLDGVLLDASKAVNVRTSGLEGADAVNLYIPFTVDATDGITGSKRSYVPPIDFFKLNDHSKFWTLRTGEFSIKGKIASTYFVKGRIVEPGKDREFMESAYDDVYSITKIDTKDFGGLQHWEVGGV